MQTKPVASINIPPQQQTVNRLGVPRHKNYLGTGETGCPGSIAPKSMLVYNGMHKAMQPLEFKHKNTQKGHKNKKPYTFVFELFSLAYFLLINNFFFYLAALSSATICIKTVTKTFDIFVLE